ncbi:MAG: hypothetical protein M3O26_01480 [Pseudomonadota bacterium]|nr:hypothetical protein [Pseudomonadota bacterium]
MNSTNDSHRKSHDDRPTKPRDGLVSIDGTIDEIGRKALEGARRLEEAEKRKSTPGSPMYPQKRAVLAKTPALMSEAPNTIAPEKSAAAPMSLTWNAVQKAYSLDATEYFARAQALGLQCPLDVFEQLFVNHHDDAAFSTMLGRIDWSTVEWSEKRLSGIVLRRVGVPRAYQYAVDEARGRTAQDGFQDERQEVMNHWQEAKTWIRSPIVLAGDLFQTALQYELIVGFTRLGNLLGALDRQDVPEYAPHTIWLGLGP